jgi:hypothetical protein
MALLGAGLLATSATAQQVGGMEFGVFGRYSMFDEALLLDNALGVGGRVGIYLKPKWMLELDYSSSPAEASDSLSPVGGKDEEYLPFHVRLNFVEPFSSRGQMVVGLGYFFQYWGPNPRAENGLTGLFGLRWDVKGPWYGRVDLTADVAPDPQYSGGDSWNVGLQAGIGVRLGGDR